MRKTIYKFLATLAAITVSLGALSLPAKATLPASADRIAVPSGSLTVTGDTVRMEITIVDSLGLLIPHTVATPIGQELKVQQIPLLATCEIPAGKSVVSLGCSGNAFVFSSTMPVVTGDSRSMTYVYTVTDPTRARLVPEGAVPGVAIRTATGEQFYAVFAGSSSAPAPESASTDADPGVSFAGFLISGASVRTVDAETAGTLRFTGKRLNQVASATIGGIAVTVSSATRSALELDFDSLPEGKHDVILTSKSGAKTTLRGFVTVN